MEFIETLLIKNGKIQNLEYHFERIKRTFNYFKFKTAIYEELKSKTKNINEKNLRMRITYNNKKIIKTEFFPLTKREFKKFKIININCNYSFKYKNRQNFQKLYFQYQNIDEFILVKNNLVTDTTISNLAFFTGSEWLTPKYPLLKGTKRQELLNKGFLKEENIHIYDLPYFKKMAMINAILGFNKITEYDIIK